MTSLDSNMRGQQHTTMDGRTLRPSLVLLDDPQTRQSARSPSQTRYRLQLLTGDVLCMAGPGESIAAVLTCTKIYAGDLAGQVLDRQKNPEWQGECTKMVYSFPSNEKLWDEYGRNGGLARAFRAVVGSSWHFSHGVFFWPTSWPVVRLPSRLGWGGASLPAKSNDQGTQFRSGR